MAANETTRSSCGRPSSWPTASACAWSPRASRARSCAIGCAALGCDVGQGYYLGRPVAGGELMDWLWEQRQVTQQGIEAIAGR